MNFGWEKEEERLLRFMKIHPMKKMEWLQRMHEFTQKFMPKRQRKIWLKIRQAR